MDDVSPELHPINFIYLAAWIVTFCICIFGARRCIQDRSTTGTDLNVQALQRIHDYRYNQERHETAESRQARDELVRKYLNTKNITREESVVELIRVLSSHTSNEEVKKNEEYDDMIQQSCDEYTTTDGENRTLPPDEDVRIDIAHDARDTAGDADNASASLPNKTSIDETKCISEVKNYRIPDPQTAHKIESVLSEHKPELPQENTSTNTQQCIPNKNEMCAICLQSFSPMDKIAWKKEGKLHCSHIFHEECLVNWLHWHDDCPLCRRVIVGADT